LVLRAHGRGRWLEVVGGYGWPLVAGKTARKHASCTAAHNWEK